MDAPRSQSAAAPATGLTPTPGSDPSFSAALRANLAILEHRDPALAEAIRTITPATLTWGTARDGSLTASVLHQGRPLALASAYDPQGEAARLIMPVDHAKHGGIVVLGLSLGYHVAALVRAMDRNALLVIYEPSVAMLRAVFERIDCTPWLKVPNVMLAAGEVDRGALLSRVEPFAGMLTQGTVLVTHPPTRVLHSEALASFSQQVTEVLAYCRTSVATALVNASRTIANLSANLAWYAAGENTNALHQAAAGYPAVCVGAGPSLAKNIDLLRDPLLRKCVVLISAQTTLRPLLDRGIEPDFVTALDYHEISRRFYESLPPLPGVTLVAEAKSHPAILQAFPGPVRVCANRFLDKLLGDLSPGITPIPDGATVAHLSFYLAQHMGCDPIMLIGQDLAFSQGLYYCPGTAIHDIWQPELGAFNTLEMMEWQRVVRHRHHLHRCTDIGGQPVYSDEQMITYHKQFERDFANAKQTIIDATEGGLPKAGTTAMPLADALAKHATRPVPPWPMAGRTFDPINLRAVGSLVDRTLADITELRQLSQRTAPILSQMAELQHEPTTMARLFDKLQPLQKRVTELERTFSLINQLNTVGAFRRARQDRAIAHTSEDPHARQRQQIERDLENMHWLTQACDEATDLLSKAQEHLTLAGTGKAMAP